MDSEAESDVAPENLVSGLNSDSDSKPTIYT